MSIQGVVTLVLPTLILLSACDPPPTAELAAAEAAVAAAREAGAPEYVPSLVEGAEAALDSAREAIEADDYEAARGFLAEATSQATDAAGGVSAAKAAVSEQLANRIEELDTELPITRVAIISLESCLKSKRKKADLDTALVGARLEKISADVAGVQAALGAGDYLAGLKGADAAGQELRRIREELAGAKAASGC